MNIRKIRRALYRGGAILGDVQAVQDSVHQKSAKPAARRLVRREVYKAEGKATRKFLRSIGL